ncbi:MAG: GAF domain-containing protein [Anaerolineaceae bacterium]|nr:GAF domain-containing protein [Anaerolineaceae bacterium]
MLSEHQRLDFLYRLTNALQQADSSIPIVLQTTLHSSARVLNAQDGCVVTFHQDDRPGEIFALRAGTRTDNREAWREFVQRGLIGYVQFAQRIIIARDITTDPRWQTSSLPDLPQTGSAVGIPLSKGGQMYGVMLFMHKEIDAFDDTTVHLLEAVSNLVSALVGNALVFNISPRDETRFQWLFEGAVVPIIVTDLDGYIVDANRKAAEFLDYRREQLLRLPITAIHRMGTGPIGNNRFNSLKSGDEVEFRTAAWRSDGTDIPVLVRAQRVFLNDHDVIAWVEQDITTQLELDQLRQDLTAMVYHDLRGPLHTVYGSLTSLGRFLSNHNQPIVLDLLQVGLRSTRQLSRMIESLLDIQRLEAGKAILDPKPTSMHNLLASAAQLIQPLATEGNQRLTFELNDELPFVEVDADMILRVVTNLMENALKYSPPGGFIRLGARLMDDSVQVSVVDSGPGIPTHMQRQIFDKFSRVKYTDVPKGIGLGLAFCRLAVEAHGGQIWVESEPGKGSSFVFTLPVTKTSEPVMVA